MKLENIIKTGIAIYCINTLAVPLFYASILKAEEKEFLSTEIQEMRGFGDIKFNDFIGKMPDGEEPESLEEQTLAWLKYSQILATSMLDYQSGQPMLKQGITSGQGNCVAFANLTYSKFLAISDKIYSAEMKNNVRIAAGVTYVKEAKLYSGHQWLEVKINREWVPFETTALDKGPAKIKVPVKPELVKHVKNKYVLRSKGYQRYAWTQTRASGEQIKWIDLIDSLKKPEGFIGWKLEQEEYRDFKWWKRKQDKIHGRKKNRQIVNRKTKKLINDRNLFASRYITYLATGKK